MTTSTTFVEQLQAECDRLYATIEHLEGLIAHYKAMGILAMPVATPAPTAEPKVPDKVYTPKSKPNGVRKEAERKAKTTPAAIPDGQPAPGKISRAETLAIDNDAKKAIEKAAASIAPPLAETDSELVATVQKAYGIHKHLPVIKLRQQVVRHMLIQSGPMPIDKIHDVLVELGIISSDTLNTYKAVTNAMYKGKKENMFLRDDEGNYSVPIGGATP